MRKDRQEGKVVLNQQDLNRDKTRAYKKNAPKSNHHKNNTPEVFLYPGFGFLFVKDSTAGQHECEEHAVYM